MKKILLSIAFAVAMAGCGGHNHNHEHDAQSHEHPVLNATKYSDSIELFVQYDELVAGHKASVTAYVTALPSFKPYEGGSIAVALKAGENNLSFNVAPERKGIYNFTLAPTAAGVGNLLFTIDGHEYPVHVHIEGGDNHGAHSHEAHHAHSHAHADEVHSHDFHGHAEESHSHSHDDEASHGGENNVSFSKEQSWKIDFATAPATLSAFNGAVKVAARALSTPDNFTTVVATAPGKVQFAGNIVAGKAVKAGEILFALEGGDVTENDAAVKFAEAESDYMVAKNNFERKSELFKDNIVSQREYEEAQAAFTRAEARFNTMQRNFASGKVALKAPYTGTVSSLLVSNGDYVAAGTPLAVVQRGGAVNITAELPVRYASLLANIASVNIELPCGTVCSMQEAEAVVAAVGTAVNSCSMLPVTVTAKHPSILPGSIVTLHIASRADDVQRVTVPRTALVEEMGNYFVFVQHTPVSFEKREVVPGATDGAQVQILKGLHAGERVVTKGGVSLKLSQGAAALDPHAGHVH